MAGLFFTRIGWNFWMRGQKEISSAVRVTWQTLLEFNRSFWHFQKLIQAHNPLAFDKKNSIFDFCASGLKTSLKNSLHTFSRRSTREPIPHGIRKTAVVSEAAHQPSRSIRHGHDAPRIREAAHGRQSIGGKLLQFAFVGVRRSLRPKPRRRRIGINAKRSRKSFPPLSQRQRCASASN